MTGTVTLICGRLPDQQPLRSSDKKRLVLPSPSIRRPFSKTDSKARKLINTSSSADVDSNHRCVTLRGARGNT
jgi:hypothetical protein